MHKSRRGLPDEFSSLEKEEPCNCEDCSCGECDCKETEEDEEDE